MPVLRHSPKMALVLGAGLLAAVSTLGTAAAAQMDHSAMDHGAMAGMDHAPDFAFGSPGKAAEADRTVRITAGDISYDVGTLTVKAGETVRFIITNRSAVDHDFTLGDAATQAEHRKEMAAMADMEAGHAHQADPNAVFVKAGETKTLVWKFGRPAVLEFACNVPGHYEAGMKGVITVK